MFLKFKTACLCVFTALLAFGLCQPVSGAAERAGSPAKPPVAGAGSAANGKNKPAVTNVTSDSMVYDSAAGKVTFFKNVKVVHPDFTLTSDKLDLFLSKDESGASRPSGAMGLDAGKVERVVALNNVKIYLPQGRSATCAQATYTVKDEVLKMEGTPQPVLKEDSNQLTGDVVYFYFKENRSEARGNVKVDFVSKDSTPVSAGSGN